MSKIDDIFSTEKTRNYSLEDKDQFVFDTLAAISTSKTQRLKRFVTALGIALGVLVICVQFILLKYASFESIVQQAELLMTQKPYLLAAFNITLIGAIIMLRRYRFF